MASALLLDERCGDEFQKISCTTPEDPEISQPEDFIDSMWRSHLSKRGSDNPKHLDRLESALRTTPHRLNVWSASRDCFDGLNSMFIC
jgi:hypothetical protein